MLALELLQYRRIKKHCFEQVSIRLILQLINGILLFLQKLLRYLNGTIISSSFVQLFHDYSVIFSLYLNEIA